MPPARQINRRRDYPSRRRDSIARRLETERWHECTATNAGNQSTGFTFNEESGGTMLCLPISEMVTNNLPPESSYYFSSVTVKFYLYSNFAMHTRVLVGDPPVPDLLKYRFGYDTRDGGPLALQGGASTFADLIGRGPGSWLNAGPMTVRDSNFAHKLQLNFHDKAHIIYDRKGFIRSPAHSNFPGDPRPPKRTMFNLTIPIHRRFRVSGNSVHQLFRDPKYVLLLILDPVTYPGVGVPGPGPGESAWCYTEAINLRYRWRATDGTGTSHIRSVPMVSSGESHGFRALNKFPTALFGSGETTSNVSSIAVDSAMDAEVSPLAFPIFTEEEKARKGREDKEHDDLVAGQKDYLSRIGSFKYVTPLNHVDKGIPPNPIQVRRDVVV